LPRRRFIKHAEIPGRIRAMFDLVYAWSRETGTGQTSNNYACTDRFSADGMRIRLASA
jgi:hypothetical protein